MKTIFDLCQPRRDVIEGRLRDEEFAADLAAVVNGKAVAKPAKKKPAAKPKKK